MYNKMAGKLTKRKKKWIERTIKNDRSNKRFLYNRFYVFILLVLGQLCLYGYFLYGFAYNSSVALIIQVSMGALSLVCVLYLINRTDKPSTRLNWIIFILVFPLVGAPMYLLYGDARSNWKLRRKIEDATRENRRVYQETYGETPISKPQTRADGIQTYLSCVAQYPTFQNGDVTYYESGEKMFSQMLDALRKAKKFILVEYFIIEHGKMWGEILKILLEKAEEGVQVRVLYDDFGCMLKLPPKYDRYLQSLHENVRATSFNKVVPIFSVKMNNRDHRKILVVDGEVAFTGGVNLADEYINERSKLGHWKDTGLKITGDAVSSFTLMFFNLFNAVREDKEDIKNYLLPRKSALDKGALKIVPYDDSPLDKISVGETVYLDLIQRAKKYVYVFTPYLVLDDTMRGALCLAALRGVDVRIVTPGIPDKKTVYRLTRANYGVLMQAGVKIYEYTPGFIHAKSMLCDGESAVVGTINLDYRSLYLHFENAVYFTGEAVKALEEDCQKTFTASRLCTKDDVKRGVVGRVFDSALRVFETLL